MDWIEANPIPVACQDCLEEDCYNCDTAEQRAALNGRTEMTYDLFWQCLQVCFGNEHMDMYKSVWEAYPDYSKNIRQHMEISLE